MKVKKMLERIFILGVMIIIMAGGAFSIYKIKNEYSMDNIEEMLISSVSDYMNEVKGVEKTATTTTAVEIMQKPRANAGGEIITSELSLQEQGYEEYLKEWEKSLKEESVLHETIIEKITMQTSQATQLETTKSKKDISQQETSKAISIADIFKSMGYNDEAMGGEEAESTSVDINSITLPYELPFELPKPMG